MQGSGSSLTGFLAKLRERKASAPSESGWSPGLLVAATGTLSASVLVLYLLITFVSTSMRFEYFNPAGAIEEAAYTYISANNYREYGFLNSGFLQDFSHSSKPADHPYAYNHMPPGPDILTALLLRVSRGSYRFSRFSFAALFVIGLVFYVKFVGLVLGGCQLRGASYTILLIGPWFLMSNLDRQPYSPFLLLGFAPLVALQAHYRTARRTYLVLALGIGLVSALYLEYVLLSAVVWCWVMLWLTQLVRVDRRHVVMFLGAIALGVVLHLFQNLLYLGPEIFAQELVIVLKNRIAGVPSQEELKAFYRSVGLVHHGSHPLNVATLVSQLALQFEFWGNDAVAVVAVASLCTLLLPSIRLDRAVGTVAVLRGEGTRIASWLTRLWLWIAGTVLMPNVMFPAFNQEVTLFGSRANLYFIAVGVVGVLANGLRLVTQPEFLRPLSALAIGVLAALGSVSGMVIAGLQRNVGDLGHGGESVKEAGKACLHWASRTLVTSPVPWSRRLFDTGVRAVLVVGIFLAAREVVNGNLGHLPHLQTAARELRYAGLADLRGFAGHLFMTNINSPTVGFFVKEAGYGVCGPDSIGETGDLNTDRCKTALMKQHDYWSRQRPRYFFFFTWPDLFPGFGDCLPSNTSLTSVRGGDECVKEMRRSLTQRFAEVFGSEVFTVFDLHATPAVGYELAPDLTPPRDLRAAPSSRTAITLTWFGPRRWESQRSEYRVERKRAFTELFVEVAATEVNETSYLATGLEPGMRHFFRVRACVSNQCSAYAYTEAYTPY